MPKTIRVLCLAILAAAIATGRAAASDLTIGTGGRVTVELITSEAAFRNTLAIASPAVAVALTGCKLEPADGLTGVRILSENISQRGCRVELDADPATGGIQPFPDNTTFRFNFCAQTDGDTDCDFIWSSDPASNSDGDDHVQTTAIVPGQVFRLAWEDQENLGDSDFNDLIAVVRVNKDTDGDGLWDDWETSGIDTDGDGTNDLTLPDADPMHKDIYVEVDWMDCAVAGGDCAATDTHSHRPKQAAIDAVVAAFAAGDVGNPDGQPGIALHVDVSNAFAHQNAMIIPNACFTGTAGTGFDAIKADAANFDARRRFAYHYSLWTHRQVAGATWSGCGELPGNDFQISFGGWNVGGGDMDGDGLADQHVGTIAQQAGTFMHELGHNLNLQHGGGDWTNFKPNYLSVMNYSFQVGGIPPTDPDAGGPLVGRVDYSRSVLPTLTETNLNEPNGIQDTTDNTTFNCPNGTAAAGAGTGAIDWNCDADGGVDAAVSSDVNGDAGTQCVDDGANNVLDTVPAGDDVVSGTLIMEGPNRQCDTTATGDDIQWRPVGPLVGFDDWASIKYDFQNTSDYEDGAHTLLPVQLQEVNYEIYLQRIAPDPAVAAKQASPDPVVTGSDLTYTITLRNNRSEGATSVTLSDLLPPSTTFVSCAADAGGVCGGTGNDRSVSFASLAGGDTATITLVANATCAVPDGTVIGNTASLSSVSPDSDSGNNAASVSVTASNPPPAISGLAPSSPQLWPPNHQMVDVTVAYTVTDNCGPVVCELSVTSNEPVNGPGDGNTAPDWEVVDDHHLRLRAERAGHGSGRIYTITTTCTDSAGGASSDTTSVLVPKSQGQ